MCPTDSGALALAEQLQGQVTRSELGRLTICLHIIVERLHSLANDKGSNSMRNPPYTQEKVGMWSYAFELLLLRKCAVEHNHLPTLIKFLVVPTFYTLSACFFIGMFDDFGTELTLETQVFTKVDLHGLFRTFCAAFGIIYDSFLADRKPDHWRVLRPVLECCRNAILLGQDLLEDVVGCTCAHCDSRATTLDARPCDKIADSQVVGVIGVRRKVVQAVQQLESCFGLGVGCTYRPSIFTRPSESRADLGRYEVAGTLRDIAVITWLATRCEPSCKVSVCIGRPSGPMLAVVSVTRSDKKTSTPASRSASSARSFTSSGRGSDERSLLLEWTSLTLV